MKLIIFIVLNALLLGGCSSVSLKHIGAPEYSRKYQFEEDGAGYNTDVAVVKLTPKAEPKSKYGNPKSYTVFGKRYYVLDSAKGYKQRGYASWYGKKFHGERTSSGETYNMYAMSAAHKTLPLPTYVKVTNLNNKKSIIVRVNDRGPFHKGRIIDLSYSAAKQLNITGKGTEWVEVEAIDPKNWTESKTEPKKQLANKFKQAVIEQQTSITKQSAYSYIQVGAFSNEDNALNLARKLRNLFNHPVITFKKKSNKQLLNIVKMGPFASKSMENTVLQQLFDYGYFMARIVKE